VRDWGREERLETLGIDWVDVVRWGVVRLGDRVKKRQASTCCLVRVYCTVPIYW
jgi:hypothetical protein